MRLGCAEIGVVNTQSTLVKRDSAFAYASPS
jgi:hypothetical protein